MRNFTFEGKCFYSAGTSRNVILASFTRQEALLHCFFPAGMHQNDVLALYYRIKVLGRDDKFEYLEGMNSKVVNQ